jgi:glycerol-3-phosphate acyltransferase PlsY
LLPLIPVTIMVAVFLWGVAFFTTRFVSVASIVAAITLPSSILVQRFLHGSWQVPLLVLTALICLMAIWRHRKNIEKLRAGTEHRFGRKRKPVAEEE